MSFGFAVGDFIAIGNLIYRVIRELQNSVDAPCEYQGLVAELQALSDALDSLQSLSPASNEIVKLDTIKSLALRCKKPLEDFLSRISKFNARLAAPSAKQSAIRDLPRRLQWKLHYSDAIRDLRQHLGANVTAINFLLITQTAQTVSTSETRQQKSIVSLATKVEEIRASETRSTSSLNDLQDVVRVEFKNQSERLDTTVSLCLETSTKVDMLQLGSQRQATAIEHILNLSSTLLNTLAHGWASLKQIQEQLLLIGRLIVKFTAEMREIAVSSMKMFERLQEALQKLESRLGQDVDIPAIRFTDAFGVSMLVPLELFRNWQTFSRFLQLLFEGKPGADRVNRGNFVIRYAQSEKILSKRAQIQILVQKGVDLKMSMVIDDLMTDSGVCPYPDCSHSSSEFSSPHTSRICSGCTRWSAASLPSKTITECIMKKVRDFSCSFAMGISEANWNVPDDIEHFRSIEVFGRSSENVSTEGITDIHIKAYEDLQLLEGNARKPSNGKHRPRCEARPEFKRQIRDSIEGLGEMTRSLRKAVSQLEKGISQFQL